MVGGDLVCFGVHMIQPQQESLTEQLECTQNQLAVPQLFFVRKRCAVEAVKIRLV